MPDQTAMPRGAFVGRYVIINQVGAGGQGVVYAAFDPELDRKVALKLLRPQEDVAAGTEGVNRAEEARSRLLREAQAMAKVAHPNVISVFDVGTHGDEVFVAMEFIDGSTLKGWIKERPRTWRETLDVFVAAGRGLAAAHAVGLVHRDFKPDNVLLGGTGRVFVTDFGLARLAGDAAADPRPQPASDPKKEEESSTSRLHAALTQQGRVVGTPQYMAPEQFLGKPPDARSDQFSFCAALYWALFGKRAFDAGEMMSALASASEERAKALIQPPPRQPRVPGWLKRALVQGLSIRPEDRFPSMEALLKRIAPRARNAPLKWGLASVALAGLAAVVTLQVRNRAQLCRGADRSLASVWDESIKQTVAAAFQATGKPYAGDLARTASTLMDAYAQAWVAMETEACEATRLRGVQTEAIFERRSVCLDQRLKELGALGRLLAHADKDVMEKAVNAAQALPSLRQCADVESLTAQPMPSDDPGVRAKVAQLGNALAEIKALTGAGKYKDALAQIQARAADLAALAYRPLEADMLLSWGTVLFLNGKLDDSQHKLEEAVTAAEAGRADRLKLASMTQLLTVIGLQGHGDEADRWARLGTATLERLGGDDELEILLLAALGSRYQRSGKYEDARRTWERRLNLVEKRFARDSPQRQSALAELASAYSKLGDKKRALELLTESYALAVRLYGAEHPNIGMQHYGLAVAYQELEDLDTAKVHAQRAVDIWEASLGPENPRVGLALNKLGNVLLKQKSYDEALATFQKALAIRSKAFGPKHPEVFAPCASIGETLLAQGHADQAIPYLERALDLPQEDPALRAEAGFLLARSLWEGRKDRHEAESWANKAKSQYLAVEKKDKAAEIDAWLANVTAPRR